MQFTDSHRRQIQRLMQDANWGGFEAYLQYYMMNNFAQSSARRDTEFSTIWELAVREGGKDHLMQFTQGLEAEARKVTT